MQDGSVHIQKIVTRDELLERRAAAGAEGRTVVQCHGCFDIVHPGHVRHLQFAARQGDILLVTITDDPNVSKGEGRPLIPRDLRAENLAALDCVDWVYVNPDPTASELLGEVRPDVYVKGKEYEFNEDPRFLAERAAVEAHGGRVVFSSGDIVFSSTALVQSLEQHADPSHAMLKRLLSTNAISPQRMSQLLDRFRGQRIAVIGEPILDTYVQCDRPDVAGESPVLSLRPLTHRSYDGGASVIARHIAALGGRPVLITAVARTERSEQMIWRLERDGIEVHAIDCPTPLPEKQRFLVGGHKMVKVDMVQPYSLDAKESTAFVDMLRSVASDVAGVVMADFGLGLFSRGVLRRLVGSLGASPPFLAGDVSGRRSSLTHMRGFDLVCPTEVELRTSVQDFEDTLNAVAWRLLDTTGARNAIVKLGGDGLVAFQPIDGVPRNASWGSRVRGEHVPSLNPHPVDTLGCGDALLASASLTMLAGGSLVEAGLVGAVAAGCHAATLGNDAVSEVGLRAGVERACAAHLSVVSSGVRTMRVSA